MKHLASVRVAGYALSGQVIVGGMRLHHVDILFANLSCQILETVLQGVSLSRREVHLFGRS